MARRGRRRRRDDRETELVELTSKPLKLSLALSGLLVFAGAILLFFAGNPLGGIMLVVGLVWHTVTKVRIWWNHG